MKPHNLKIDWLRCFVAIVDAGSLSAAAREVNRSQSSVSVQLRKLERAVGTPLMIRDARKRLTTPTGDALLSYARQILDLHDDARRLATSEELRACFKIGVENDAAAKLLAPIVGRFKYRHREIDVELTRESSTQLLKGVSGGRLDVAFLLTKGPHKGAVLASKPIVWVASSDLRLWERDILPIALTEEAVLGDTCTRALATQGRRYRVVYFGSGVAGALAAVQSGIAIAALPECYVPDGFEVLGCAHGLPSLGRVDLSSYRNNRSPSMQAIDLFESMLAEALQR